MHLLQTLDVFVDYCQIFMFYIVYIVLLQQIKHKRFVQAKSLSSLFQVNHEIGDWRGRERDRRGVKPSLAAWCLVALSLVHTVLAGAGLQAGSAETEGSFSFFSTEQSPGTRQHLPLPWRLS